VGFHLNPTPRADPCVILLTLGNLDPPNLLGEGLESENSSADVDPPSSFRSMERWPSLISQNLSGKDFSAVEMLSPTPFVLLPQSHSSWASRACHARCADCVFKIDLGVSD